MPNAALLVVPNGPLPAGIKPLAYTLSLALDPASETFAGSVVISIHAEQATGLIWLHGQDLQVDEGYAVSTSGQRHALRYRQMNADGVASIAVNPALQAGEAALHLRFTAPLSAGLMGIYRVHAGLTPYIYSQFEPLSARRAFPCFDEPRFKVPFQVDLTVPDGDVAVSNALPVAERTTGNGKKTITFAPTAPLPTYLLAVAVGPFDVLQAEVPLNSMRAEPLPLRGLTVAGRGHEMQFAISHAASLLDALEQYFEAPYPFSKLDLIAVPDFAAGAMENAGAITFRDWLLLMDLHHASASQRHSYYSVVAHELSHQWFGNWVTMAWWNDLWLNESFATWMGARIAQQLDPKGHYDVDLLQGMHNVMVQDSLTSARRVRQPCPQANDVDSAFDGITYAKGGALLNMFEHYAGREPFAAGVRAYLSAHPFASATADDFLGAITLAHGDPNLGNDFKTFLDQSGVPELGVDVACTPNGATLQLTQKPYIPLGRTDATPRLWHIPVCWRAGFQEGVQQQCTMLREAVMSVPLGPRCPQWLLPNADGVGYYLWRLPAGELAALQQVPLSETESLGVAYNLQRAYAAGTLGSEATLAALEKFTASPYRSVAVAPLGLWRFIYDEMLDAPLRAKAAVYMKKHVQPRAKILVAQGHSADAEATLWRRQLLDFLAMQLQDSPTRDALATIGVAYTGWSIQGHQPADGVLHSEQVDAELADLALTVAAEIYGDPFIDHLLHVLATNVGLGAGQRQQIVGALARVRTPAAAARLRDMALQETPFRSNEVIALLRNHMGEPHLRPTAWHFIKENFAALKARLPQTSAGNLPALTGYFCDRAAAQDAKAFFTPHIEELAGGPRALAQAQEAIALCFAQREAQAPGVGRFFAALPQAATTLKDVRHHQHR